MRTLAVRAALIALIAVAGFRAGLAGEFADPAADGGRPASVQTSADDAALMQFRADLLEIVARGGWTTDRWGVLVVSMERGDTLFALNEHESFVPASNLKLFTTAAALQALGADFRYGTYLLADGALEAGALEGDLILYGTGDPTFSDRFLGAPNDVWEAFADSLRRMGVREVRGDLVADASYFGPVGVSLGWQDSYRSDAYAALPGALAYNDNAVSLRILPGEAVGHRPRIEYFPGGGKGIAVVNTARTVAGNRSRLRIRRAAYDGPILISGQIGRGSRDVWRQVAVANPARYAGATLREVLEAHGIRIAGRVRVVERPEASPVTGRTVQAPTFERRPPRLLATHRSPPLVDILDVVNRRSHNLYAEQVLRTIGRVETGEGSLAAGTRAAVAYLAEAGVDLSGLRMRDGSGLSADNRVEPATIVSLLARMTELPAGRTFLATLPEAGDPRGLRRMAKTSAEGRLRAKTGTIERVSALAGYVRAADGELLGFSIVANGVPSTWTAKRVEDALGARMARFRRPAPSVGRLAAEGGAAAGSSSPDAGGAARTALGGGSVGSYTIRKGDTLEGIAKEHGVTVTELRQANPGVRDRRLMPGQALTLP
ncbi:MAG TPA: D-alanyl-D-alanine carboxypeptidase/D-alanyl-D-alanine-endopeptidase [Longimicrobiales bacterium]|nr:D-alanyl-D-alanine carboxypeptidase/D-alanyl-D-alanine-endopeptidase [Longimicrobiales bacterium]